ncbi:uracil-DNA glycosylase [Gluconacetobacter diazotrophicus]|uniref:Type-4 uracil-DNA glycosylase n=2 Tax=Gluconacetobacter diazotrophicus TaxID=33996 RepID=A0A7W4I7K8_GLUDI|nr:uracil-DNA glycosylase [Gluconacetobacter diazotrophicus]
MMADPTPRRVNCQTLSDGAWPPGDHPHARGRPDRMMDALALLQLYAEWGADVAFDDSPTDHLAARPPPPARAGIPPARDDAPSPPARPAGRAAVEPDDGLTLVERAIRQARDAAAAAENLPALHAALAAFGGCALRDTATHTVVPEGPAGARLLLIGEPPDAAEDRSGTAFAGPAGQILDRMLTSIGLARTDMLLAPVIPWRPPGERPPSAAELQICAPFLHRLIVLANPRRIILMGNTPARLLTGEQGGIARLRGRWRDVAIPGLGRAIPILPMRHPSQLGASPAARRDAWKDIVLLRTTLDQDQDTE